MTLHLYRVNSQAEKMGMRCVSIGLVLFTIAIASSCVGDSTVAEEASSSRTTEICRLLKRLNEIAGKEYSYAQDNPDYLLAGETNALVGRYVHQLWKMGMNTRWETKTRQFIVHTDFENGKTGGLLILFRPNHPFFEWELHHPGLPMGYICCTSAKLRACIEHLKVTNWVAVYPNHLGTYSKEVNLLGKIGQSLGIGAGSHLMYNVSEQKKVSEPKQ